MTRQTIAAIATPPGRGGVGIVRISGPNVKNVAQQILGFTPQPRYAHYCVFKGADAGVIDQGLALFFPTPHSFTGEDVLELQGHGGPIVLDLLLQEILKCGVRLARPGEFSEQAFLNDKLDLAQAEAIADLIDASSVQAAKHALNSLQGAFSVEVNALVEQLAQLRVYVEAAIDFPDEEVDFLSDGKIASRLQQIIESVARVQYAAQQGTILRDGMKVVIAGRPNAGKSSLLNALTDKDTAIVTDIAGTTRDVLREFIHIEGMPLHIIDTAGLRDSPDKVEQIGIERAWAEIDQADRILLLIDTTQKEQLNVEEHWPDFTTHPARSAKLTVVFNKVDQTHFSPAPVNGRTQLSLSAKTGQGLAELKHHLKLCMGFEGTTEGGFSARRRHLEALAEASEYLQYGRTQLLNHCAGELLAEDLRQAQNALSQITGSFTSDDLLGKIFSSFCIGK